MVPLTAASPHDHRASTARASLPGRRVSWASVWPDLPRAAWPALRALHPSSSSDSSWSPGQDILKGLLMKGDNGAPRLPVPGASRARFPWRLPLQLTPGLEGTELASKVTSRDEQGASRSTQGRFGPNPCDTLHPEREKNSRGQAGCGGGGNG